MGHEYVVNLRETQQTSKLNIKRRKGITIAKKKKELPLTGLLSCRDSEIRVVIARIAKTNATSRK